MSVHGGGQRALEYYPCRYGTSRILFRGPRRLLDGSYVAFLGSTETYGRFVEAPYPALLEDRLAVSCVNFGVVNAGVDLYLNDPGVMGLAAGAGAKVVQVMGAQNLSNRYYSVHPRRNDRFLRASDRLEALYPEVDFTEFHFVRHLLGKLGRDLARAIRHGEGRVADGMGRADEAHPDPDPRACGALVVRGPPGPDGGAWPAGARSAFRHARHDRGVAPPRAGGGGGRRLGTVPLGGDEGHDLQRFRRPARRRNCWDPRPMSRRRRRSRTC